MKRLLWRWTIYPGLLTLLLLLSISAMAPSPRSDAAVTVADALPVELIHTRAERTHARLEEVEAFYETRIAPIERVLLRQRGDTMLAKRIAVAIWRESRATRLSPWLLTGVMLVENPWLAPDTASFVGARGLMQVMPMHAGNFGCGSRSLSDVDSNVCHGARILAHYYTMSGGDLNRALLRYNGCVRGTNTPDCHTYPSKVMRHMRRARFFASAQPVDLAFAAD